MSTQSTITRKTLTARQIRILEAIAGEHAADFVVLSRSRTNPDGPTGWFSYANFGDYENRQRAKEIEESVIAAGMGEIFGLEIDND